MDEAQFCSEAALLHLAQGADKIWAVYNDMSRIQKHSQLKCAALSKEAWSQLQV